MGRIQRTGVLFLLLGLCLTLAPRIQASQANVTITVGVWPGTNTDQTTQTIAQFEADHPNIHVALADLPDNRLGSSADVTTELKDAQQLVSMADVIPTDAIQLSEPVTIAGDFLDLKPLLDADQTFDPNNYVPAVWQSWNWDGGVWGIPAAFDLTGLFYDPAAFDQAGLTYPNDQWTIDDFTHALRVLAQKNGEPPLQLYDEVNLFRSLTGVNLFDPTAIPNPPLIEQPAVEKLVTEWAAVEGEKLINPDFHQQAPLIIDALSSHYSASSPLAATLLPGGNAGVITTGYSISAGTQYPQQAYELARFLAGVPQFTTFREVFPARRDAVNAAIAKLPSTAQTVIQHALDHALPAVDLRYFEYVADAIQQVHTGKADARSALQAAQANAVQALQIAAKLHGAALAVATPIPVSTLLPNQVALKFAVDLPKHLPNQADWDAVIAAFTQSDPEVRQIILDTSGKAVTNRDDCVYQSRGAFSGNSLRFLKNLDPLMELDPAFDKSDFLKGVLAQVQFDQKTWAYPLNIQPAVMTYDPVAFAKAGVPAPTNGWTLDQFIDALKRLHTDPTMPAFDPNDSLDGAAYLMLIAAYGGQPIDYHTSPLTARFTDKTSVDAIRQVLDLAKAGYIRYTPDMFPTLPGGIPLQASASPIQTDIMNVFSFRMNVADYQSAYRVALYPSGSDYVPLSYSIGSAVILASSPHPDACYRWISTLAKHPELFYAMPARHSQIADPTLVNKEGSDAVAAYKQIEQQLSLPNAITVPSYVVTFPELIVERWLFQAFSAYVLKNADLDSALQDAQSQSLGFLACVADVPAYDPTDPQNNYLGNIKTCAVKLDPTAGMYFGPSS